jgi:hypothetical protein
MGTMQVPGTPDSVRARERKRLNRTSRSHCEPSESELISGRVLSERSATLKLVSRLIDPLWSERVKKIGGNNVQVAFEDGSQACLPDWTLDEQACADIHQSDAPCILIEALRRLRRLLDAQPLVRRMQHGTGEDILHAPTEYVSPKPPADHSGFGGRAFASASAGGKGPLHRPAEPEAPLPDRGQDCEGGDGQ